MSCRIRGKQAAKPMLPRQQAGENRSAFALLSGPHAGWLGPVRLLESGPWDDQQPANRPNDPSGPQRSHAAANYHWHRVPGPGRRAA
jgi:hypothetical protein